MSARRQQLTRPAAQTGHAVSGSGHTPCTRLSLFVTPRRETHLTSFLAVVACGRLPRATRPGPRLGQSYNTPRGTCAGALQTLRPDRTKNDVGGVPEA